MIASRNTPTGSAKVQVESEAIAAPKRASAAASDKLIEIVTPSDARAVKTLFAKTIARARD